MKETPPVLVCCDRDGTLIRDENYYLGSQDNWRDLLEVLPGVIEGLAELGHLERVVVFIITNQSGVALCGPRFEKLTEERMREVNQEVIAQIQAELRARDTNPQIVGGYLACPYVSSDYVREARGKGRDVNPLYVNDTHPDIKPSPGMVFTARYRAKDLFGLTNLSEIRTYVIGDRASDVECGLNAQATSVFVPGFKTAELKDCAKVERLKQRPGARVHVTDTSKGETFYHAMQWIANDVK